MKIQNALVSNWFDQSQRYFAHVTTVILSWRVQNIVVIGRVYSKLERSEFSSNFEFDRNMFSGTGAWPANMTVAIRWSKIRFIPIMGSYTGTIAPSFWAIYLYQGSFDIWVSDNLAAPVTVTLDWASHASGQSSARWWFAIDNIAIMRWNFQLTVSRFMIIKPAVGVFFNIFIHVFISL